MSQRLIDVALPRIADAPLAVPALIAVHLLFNVLANVGFRLSARAGTWTDVVAWQIGGNVAGLVTVLALTALLRYWPLSIAFPVTTGASIIAVQVVAARWIFAEPIGPMQWSGALLIVLGVFLVQR